MAADGDAGAAARVTQLEESLETMAETLRHGIVILEDYKIENQDALWTKMCAHRAASARALTGYLPQ